MKICIIMGSNCSVKEALRKVEKIKNIHIKRKYIDKSRIGDHKWWIVKLENLKKIILNID